MNCIGVHISNKPIMFRTSFNLEWKNDDYPYVLSLKIFIIPKEKNEYQINLFGYQSGYNGYQKTVEIELKKNRPYLFDFDSVAGKLTISCESELIKDIPADFPRTTFAIRTEYQDYLDFSFI